MNKAEEELYKKYMNKEELSLKDKLKAKIIVAKFMARNGRTVYQANNKIKKAQKSIKNCEDCNKKVKELSKTKYSDEKAYKMICDGYFCEKCTPSIKEHHEFMMNVKRQGLKL